MAIPGGLRASTALPPQGKNNPFMILDCVKDDDVDMLRDVSLSDYTTFRLGGRCPCLITCQEPAQLEKAVQLLSRENIHFILIGSGSNLVVSDEGIDCVVIRYVSAIPRIKQAGTEITVSASTLVDSLALYAAEQGLAGLNCTTGIPGTVGGAIAGNAGAFGRQIGDVVKSVKILGRNPANGGVPATTYPQDLHFSYRNSILKETHGIVLEATFSLSPGDKDALMKERQEILELRRQKHPDLISHPCAGSFFRNVEPTSKAGKRQAAGWFLEQAGAKQLHCGGAAVFEKHANIIIKSDNATAQDVFNLSRKMAQLVKDQFNLDLIREVRFVGRFKGADDNPQNSIW